MTLMLWGDSSRARARVIWLTPPLINTGSAAGTWMFGCRATAAEMLMMKPCWRPIMCAAAAWLA
ncbi:hypothetical protein D3C78_1550460 [compost metagenome]